MAVQTLHYVGLDVGGQTMKAAVVDDSGAASPAVTKDTNAAAGQARGLETMVETIRAAVAAAGLAMKDIAAIGVATPGLMDLKAGIITDPPNLKPWKNVPVRSHVETAFGMKGKVAFQNDANAAAYGEFWVGAGKGFNSMCLFTLGTGIGGGIIVNGSILEGEHSHGAEVGHMRIDLPDRGRLCGCGRRGCLEAYASAVAIAERTKEELATWRGPSKLRELLRDADGRDITEADCVKIFDVAKHGDELAMKIVDDTAYYLALGACALMATVDPQAIVFGGGMTKTGEHFLVKIDEYVRRFGLTLPAERVKILYASKGTDAGFIGAAGCARMLVAG